MLILALMLLLAGCEQLTDMGMIPSKEDIADPSASSEALPSEEAIKPNEFKDATSATPVPTPTEEPSESPSETPKQTPSVPDDGSPMIALTFDDGPAKATSSIIDLLVQNGGKGTFFIVGERIENNTEVIQKMIDNGMQIGCHTENHENLKKLDDSGRRSQITQMTDTIKELFDYDITILRPPGGNTNDEVNALCRDLGLAVINWSIDTLDWKTKDPDATYDAILDNVKDGDIILCHDLYTQTGEAMERVIPALAERGFKMVTVSELLSHSEDGQISGKKYLRRDS